MMDYVYCEVSYYMYECVQHTAKQYYGYPEGIEYASEFRSVVSKKAENYINKVLPDNCKAGKLNSKQWGVRCE